MSLFAQLRRRFTAPTAAPQWLDREDFLRLSRQVRTQRPRPEQRPSVADDWLAVPA